MRFRNNKNPTGERPGDKKKICPECGGAGGQHQRVRFSEAVRKNNQITGYKIVWKDCPRK